jgi:hypothetical protein
MRAVLPKKNALTLRPGRFSFVGEAPTSVVSLRLD